jgi:glycosyltransferase involved in cell wall biosynthesis
LRDVKVLFCLTSLGAGGTERSTALLLPELRDRGIECEVAVLERTEVGNEQRVVAQGFEILHVAGATRAAKIRALRKLVAQRRPDVLHTAVFDADLVGRLAGWRSGCAVVSSLINTSYAPERLQDSNVHPLKLKLARAVDGWTARHLTHTIHAVSEGVARANAADLRIPRAKIIVVERGRKPLEASSAASRESVRASLGISRDALLLLAVGRVEFQKSHVDLVESIDLLRRHSRFADAQAVIAGRSGNASALVAEAIEKRDLAKSVRVLGHRDDIADLLLAADVFVLPSRYEGTAGAALEAMAAGVPIVTADVAGLEGVLQDQRNALLTPIGDAAALATAVETIMSDDALRDRLVATAHSDFEERFTLARCADRMRLMYLQVCDSDASSQGARSSTPA